MSDHGLLEWGVREGWRAYVAALPDGSFVLDGGVEYADGVFRFPRADPVGDTPGTARFRGTVTARGHFGMTLGYLIDPWVEVDADGARITVVRWPGHDERIALVTLTGDPAAGPAEAALTLEGTEIFGGVYRADSPMDPVVVTGSTPHDADTQETDAGSDRGVR
jgi:Htaa.